MIQVIHTNFNIRINVANTIGVNEWKICTLWVPKTAHVHSRDHYNLQKVVDLQKLYTKECISVLQNITVVKIVEAVFCRRSVHASQNVRQTHNQNSTLQVMKKNKTHGTGISEHWTIMYRRNYAQNWFRNGATTTQIVGLATWHVDQKKLLSSNLSSLH